MDHITYELAEYVNPLYEKSQMLDFNSNATNEDNLYAEFDDAISLHRSTTSVSKKGGKWSREEDLLLKELVAIHGTKNWKKISEHLNSRSPVQCLHRWTKILKPGLTKGPWTIEEDRKLLEWVRLEGATRWSHCAEFITGRSGKQCRERWFNTLNPNVKKGSWSHQEDYLIFKYFSEYGSKWSQIALNFPGRTENSIKNRFYSTLRRIASDTKKKDKLRLSPSEFSETLSTSPSTSSLEELLKYFPQALEEKTKVYNAYKAINIDEDLEEELPVKLLNKKVNRDEFKQPQTTNINSTYNFNVNINNNKVINNEKQLYEDLKKSNIEDLESIISGFCSDDININNDYIKNSTLTDKKCSCINRCISCNNLIDNQSLSINNNDSISALLNQLSELEVLLQNTKNQLCSLEKNNCVSRNINTSDSVKSINHSIANNDLYTNNFFDLNTNSNMNLNFFEDLNSDSLFKFD